MKTSSIASFHFTTWDFFKQNLRYYRKGKGYTQERFAERCNISASYYAKLEAPNCTELPSPKLLTHLAFHLDVDVMDLFWVDWEVANKGAK